MPCLPGLLTVSFTERLEIFMKSNFLIFAFRGCIHKVTEAPEVPRFSMLSHSSFKVMHVSSRSMVHIELVFVKGVRLVSRVFFTFLHVNV